MGTNEDVFWKQVETAPLSAHVPKGPVVLRSEVDISESVKVPPNSVLRISIERNDFSHSFVNYLSRFGPITDWEEWTDDILANLVHIVRLTSVEILDNKDDTKGGRKANFSAWLRYFYKDIKPQKPSERGNPSGEENGPEFDSPHCLAAYLGAFGEGRQRQRLLGRMGRPSQRGKSPFQSSKSNDGAFQVNVAEVSPRQTLSSMPKPLKKKAKAKAKCTKVFSEAIVLEAKGAQEARDVPSGPSVPETVPSETQARVGDSAEGLAHDIKKGDLLSSYPIANLNDTLVRELQSSWTMAEDDDGLHNLIPDVLKTMGLSNDTTEPSVTADMNLVEELDATLEPLISKILLYSIPLPFLKRGGVPESGSGILEPMPSCVEWNGVLVVPQYVNLLGRALGRHLSIFAKFTRRAMIVRTSCFELLGNILLSLSSLEAKDISLDFLADLSGTVEVLERDALTLSWLRNHLVRLGHVPRHIAYIRELHQLESEHAKLCEQVTSFKRRITELKTSCDMGGVELGLGEEGLRRSTLLDIVYFHFL
ncbi:hypothetical protein F0562_022348 [Nyssa sinensis]|uniref:Aminotransferase-like plant mobile domain-containing protein n=1 Tax=Nyssa sinensis TaxID=561372 RepID=A0A5J5BNP5_9ASTE|nr:hypothetical protein F0562_022348 [Nyssa sinensis]